MSSWAQSDPLRGRPRRAWAFDAAVALCAMLFAVQVIAEAYAIKADERVPLPLAWVLVLVPAAGLVVRRVWPLPTFAGIVVVLAGAGLWGEDIVWSLAPAIALYTVAARCPRRIALGCAGVLAVAVTVWASRVYPDDRGWQQVAIGLVLTVVAITVFGLYVGTRRTLMLELRDRAVRLEHERDQQAELAAAGERARIARELHDIVAHHLTVMVALADGAAAQVSRSPDQAQDAMRTVSATGRQALTDTRRLLGVLRAATEPGAGRSPLPGLADLDELVDGVRAAGLAVRYEVAGPLPELDQGTQLALYRLVQEALTNTMKHAGPAASAVVRIGSAAGELIVEVLDDGVAPASATPSTGPGRGLDGMRERVAAVGGEVISGPAPGGGWAVRARVGLTSVDAVVATDATTVSAP